MGPLGQIFAASTKVLRHLKDNEMGHCHSALRCFHRGSLHGHRYRSSSPSSVALALQLHCVVAPRRDGIPAFAPREGARSSRVTAGLGGFIGIYSNGAFDAEEIGHAAWLELEEDGVVNGIELGREEVHVLVDLIQKEVHGGK